MELFEVYAVRVDDYLIEWEEWADPFPDALTFFHQRDYKLVPIKENAALYVDTSRDLSQQGDSQYSQTDSG